MMGIIMMMEFDITQLLSDLLSNLIGQAGTDVYIHT